MKDPNVKEQEPGQPAEAVQESAQDTAMEATQDSEEVTEG
jgi:hypothetical protein